MKHASERKVTVAEAIRELNSQLMEISKQLETDAHLRFSTRAVEVELTILFKVASEGGGLGRAGQWFLDTSNNAEQHSETKHKVKLVLSPNDLSGQSAALLSGVWGQSNVSAVGTRTADAVWSDPRGPQAIVRAGDYPKPPGT
jgi:Trypsin-co-occurring domain 2